MKKINLILLGVILNLVWSCSSSTPVSNFEKSSESVAIYTGDAIDFPVRILHTGTLSDQIKDKDTLVVYNDRIFSKDKSAQENTKAFQAIEASSAHYVILTVDDLAIIENQNLNFDKSKVKFINTGIYSSHNDQVLKNKFIVPYIVHKDVVVLGLTKETPALQDENSDFYVADYALALLQTKAEVDKVFSKNKNKKNEKVKSKSFLIIHDLGSGIDEIVERLPKHFINY